MIEMAKMVSEYGLAVGIFFLCCWVVRHVVVNQTAALDRNTNALVDLNTRVEKAEERQDEAHKYQREEHVEMIKVLHRMNGAV